MQDIQIVQIGNKKSHELRNKITFLFTSLLPLKVDPYFLKMGISF